MFIPASQGTAIVELGSRGRDRTVDHRVKACCRNRLATRLCVAVSSGWSRLCLPCRIWQTHRRYSALSTRGWGMRPAFFAGHLCGSIPRNNDYSLFNLADGVGFEPTDAFTSAVFKTAALGRSATRPVQSLLNLTSLLPFFLASYWVALAFGSASFGCSILSGWLPSHGAFRLLSGWCAGRVRLPRSS